MEKTTTIIPQGDVERQLWYCEQVAAVTGSTTCSTGGFTRGSILSERSPPSAAEALETAEIDLLVGDLNEHLAQDAPFDGSA